MATSPPFPPSRVRPDHEVKSGERRHSQFIDHTLVMTAIPRASLTDRHTQKDRQCDRPPTPTDRERGVVNKEHTRGRIYLRTRSVPDEPERRAVYPPPLTTKSPTTHYQSNRHKRQHCIKSQPFTRAVDPGRLHRRWVLTTPRPPPARHRPPPRRCAHGPSQHRASWARALPRAAASAPPPTRPGRGLSPPSLPLTSPSLNFDPSPGLKEKGQYRSIKLERSNDYVTAAATCSWSRGRRAFIAVAVP